MFKEMLKYACILMVVTITASGSLALVNNVTTSKIDIQKQKELNLGLSYVLPGTSEGVIVPVQSGSDVYYIGYGKSDTTQLIGYAFSCYGQGYSSEIWTLVGMDSNGVILKINILDQKETPGLGTRCVELKPGESEPWWQIQFQGKKATSVALDKDDGEIVAITGATITSRAITDAIRERSKSIWIQLNSQE